MPYPTGELERMLTDVESELVERKESLSGSAREAIREAVCAFSNDIAGRGVEGVVFVGAKDNGDTSGLRIDERLINSLADMKTDGRILPPPSMSVEKKELLGSEFAIISVRPSQSPPVRFDGRVWIRVGARRVLASAQDERVLNERRRFADLPFDAQPVPSARLDDLSRRIFEEEYVVSAVARDVLETNERSYEQRLAATKMIDSMESATPTVLGLLVIGTRPRDFLSGSYVQFVRIDGTEMSDPVVDEQVIDGGIADIVRRTEDKLKANISIKVDFATASRERRSADFPIAALQQLFRNAVMHRAYEATNAPVRITWFRDRVEIWSPGGPFGVVTVENFGRAGLADYRNPNLAEAMRVLGFVQKFGAGIPIARKALADNGNPPPEFEARPNAVQCVVRIAA